MFNTIFGKTLKTVNPFISGMSDFRENYLKAREVVAEELKRKYNLIESYSDNDRLTLDSTNYSIHLTFYLPEGENVSISEKGKEPGYGYSFMQIVFEKYPKRNEMILFLKELFSELNQFDYSFQTIKEKLLKKSEFIQKQHPEYFM